MYILVTGAPGSKWSSVVKNIYWSDDIDHSDYSEDRTYRHDADTPGHKQLMHIGAYWDPGMEFDNSRKNWDGPFTGTGRRIIKSHTFAHQLNELKTTGYPIVMVLRSNLDCYDWWKLCGEFSITYPNYQYFEDLDKMWKHIQNQNIDITQFIQQNLNRISCPVDNFDLCRLLGIKEPGPRDSIHTHNYAQKGIRVYVYK